MVKAREYIERILLYALVCCTFPKMPCFAAWKNAWITYMLCQIQYAVLQCCARLRLSQCDMLKLHLADYVYSRACTCSSQSVLYQLVREENKDRKVTPCFVQNTTVAALHVTLQRNGRQLRLTRLM